MTTTPDPAPTIPTPAFEGPAPRWAPRAHRFGELSAERTAPWASFGSWPEGKFFPEVVGLVLEDMRQDYGRMTLPYRPENRQPQGLVHGGAIATLIDTVVVPAIASGYPEFRPFSTITMNVRYLAAVTDQDIIAEGWITKRGGSIVFCDVECATPDGEVVATGELTYRVFKPRA